MYLQKYYNSYWSYSDMWKYSNPNLTLTDPQSINFQTPISGTVNVTLTNNTGSVINNTTSTTNTVSTSGNSNFSVQSSSGNWAIWNNGNTTRYVRYFSVSAGVTYTITDSTSTTRTKNYGISATTTWPTSGNHRSLEGGGGSFKTTTTFTASITGRCYVSYAPSENTTLNPSLTVKSTTTIYNLSIADSGDRDNYVDLGQSTLAVNETITVPITFTSSTNWFYFYYNGTVGNWPEVSFSYTGWSIRNPSNVPPIHERNNGSWT